MAGGADAGSQAPVRAEPVNCSTAATTCPTLVRMCRAMARAPRSILPRDWTTMACGATEMPVSVLPTRGPASVKAWTLTSADSLPGFMR